MALPSHLETTSLRLYLLNIQSRILILGNGGLKSTAKYQEDANLNKCVETLQKINKEEYTTFVRELLAAERINPYTDTYRECEE